MTDCDLEKTMPDKGHARPMDDSTRKAISAWKKQFAPTAYLAEQRDNAYHERDRLVSFLSTLYRSHLAHPDDAEPGWQYVVCIHAPCGQLSWHIPDHEVPELFAHLPIHGSDWDGHSTDEKYRRLDALGKQMLETRIA